MNVNFNPVNLNFRGNVQQKRNYGKKALTAFVVGTVALNATKVAIGIGRNPAKAAKVLKGTSKIKDELYAKALKKVGEIFNSGNKKVQEAIEEAIKLFDTDDMLYANRAFDNFERIDDYISAGKLAFDDETQKIYTRAKENLYAYIEMLKKKPVADYDEGEKLATEFFEKNHRDLDKIESYVNNTEGCYVGSFCYGDYDFKPNAKIIECPKELLNRDGIYYHGTKNASKIYKEGLTPYKSNQTQARELGAAIYTTPSKRVAAGFSDIQGNIIPIKLAKDAKVAYLGESAFNSMGMSINKILTEMLGKKALQDLSESERGKLVECLTSELYKKAGYDAIYAPKGYKGGLCLFTPDVNKVLGADQAQLAVLSPEKIEITSNDFLSRVKDVKDKFATTTNMLKWFSEHPLGF